MNFAASLQVWENNLKRLKDQLEKQNRVAKIDDAEILEFAQKNIRKLHWNGRQIRNAFQTAYALAEYEASGDGNEKKKKKKSKKGIIHIRQRHFLIVTNAAKDFDAYLKELVKQNHLVRNGYRVDDKQFEEDEKP